MTRMIAYVLLALFTALLVFQVLLALGAPLGAAAWGGEYTVLPITLRMGSLISAAICGAAMLIVLEKLGFTNLIKRSRVISILLFLLAILFSLSALANAASSSKWENFLMLPVAVVLAFCCALLALRKNT